MRLSTLKRSAEFQRVRGGLRVATPLFVIECRSRTDEQGQAIDRRPRVGFTITKKLGGAVVRNHIRRRLKEIFRSLVGLGRLKDGHDYVVVARTQIVERPYGLLSSAVEQAVERLHGKTTRQTSDPEIPEIGERKSRKRQLAQPARDTAPRAPRSKTPL